MPLIYVQRYIPPKVYLTDGEQFVDGTLQFAGPTTIYLSNAVYGTTGDYILFKYGSFNAADLSNVTINTNDLILSEAATPALTNDSANNRILLSLKSKSSNGTQFVDGTLTITSPMDVYLDSTLYATAGVYTLFDWSGGGSFSGSASNITVHPPAGLYVASAPSVVGSTIQFTLA